MQTMSRTAWLACLVGCGGTTAIGESVPPAVDTEGPSDAPTTEQQDWDVPVSTPVVGGATLTLHDGIRVAASDVHSGQVVLVNLDTFEVEAVQQLPENSEPNRMAQGDAGTLWVAQRRSGHVTGLSTSDLSVVAQHWVCPAPRGIDSGHDGTLWVACGSGELIQFDDVQILRRLELGPDLRDVVVDPWSDRIWVSRFRAGQVIQLDGAGNVLRTEQLPSARFEQFLNGASRPPVDVRFDGRVAWRMVPHPEDGVAVLHQRLSSTTIRTTPDQANLEVPPPYYGPPEASEPGTPGRRCAGIVHTALTHVPTEGDPITSSAIWAAAVPTDLTFVSDDTIVMAVAGAKPGSMSAASLVDIDVDTLWDRSTTCVIPGSTRAAGSALIHSVASNVDGRLVSVSGPPFKVRIGNTVVHEAGEAGHAGLELFHRNANLGVSCASCHPEGADDGYVWTFENVGPRRTQSLVGGLLDTAPFHWQGDLHDMADLMDETFVIRMGGDPMSHADVEDMADWMDGLPTVPTSGRGTTTQVSEGEQLFVDLGCAACHVDGILTDNQSHDVGTGGVFQTPSLRGVAQRLPLMHTGCATSLTRRFDPECGGTNHGDVSDLTPPQVDALVSYLETL
ncbi:MAG: c-type cytochrome [Myxococcales bacterium]|nr:c-type cytochrome [Myxococcales bacterium]